MSKTVIEVEITKIKADARYYSFYYKVWVNGKLKKEDSYDSDHSWSDDVKGFKEYLRDGGAVKTALEHAF